MTFAELQEIRKQYAVTKEELQAAINEPRREAKREYIITAYVENRIVYDQKTTKTLETAKKCLDKFTNGGLRACITKKIEIQLVVESNEKELKGKKEDAK